MDSESVRDFQIAYPSQTWFADDTDGAGIGFHMLEDLIFATEDFGWNGSARQGQQVSSFYSCGISLSEYTDCNKALSAILPMEYEAPGLLGSPDTSWKVIGEFIPNLRSVFQIVAMAEDIIRKWKQFHYCFCARKCSADLTPKCCCRSAARILKSKGKGSRCIPCRCGKGLRQNYF